MVIFSTGIDWDPLGQIIEFAGELTLIPVQLQVNHQPELLFLAHSPQSLSGLQNGLPLIVSLVLVPVKASGRGCTPPVRYPEYVS